MIRRVMGEWNRVETRGPERPAAGQAAKGQPAATPHTMDGDRLVAVFGAGREEAARRQATLGRSLVPADRSEHHALDAGSGERVDVDVVVASVVICSTIDVIATRICSNVSSIAAGRAPISIKLGGSGDRLSSSRRTARIRRRSRFRSTAGPKARLIANATEACFDWGSGHQVHHSAERRIRRPSRARCSKAPRSEIRRIKPTDGRGPCRDGS